MGAVLAGQFAAPFVRRETVQIRSLHTATVAETVEEYIDWGRSIRAWSDGHAVNVKRQVWFWIHTVPLESWASFTFLAARVEVIAGRVFRGMSVDTLSTDSNKTLRLSRTTLKAYASALLAWCRWLANPKRRLISSENLQDLEAVEWPRSEREKDEHRRPYTQDELKRLFWICEPDRRLLYWVAIETGYRHSELSRLIAADFDPHARTLSLSSARTKNHKAARATISHALASQLAGIAARLAPDAKLLNVPAKGARTIYADLKRAGIDPRDHGKGRLDFHSLRGSAAALKFAAGGRANEVQRFMRHSSGDLTVKYAKHEDARLGELNDKVATMTGAADERERTLWDFVHEPNA